VIEIEANNQVENERRIRREDSQTESSSARDSLSLSTPRAALTSRPSSARLGVNGSTKVII
jgi:hypothetical protein